MHPEMEKDKLLKMDVWYQKIKQECDPALNSLLAVHFESQNNYEEAFSQMALAVEKDALRKNLCQKLVWVAQQAEKLDQARELIESLLLRNTENTVLRRGLGLAYLLQREYPVAIKNLQASLKFNQKDKLTHFLLGCSFLGLLERSKGDIDSQSELLDSALKEFQKLKDMPFFQKDTDFQEGIKYLIEKSYSKSLEKMESVLQKVKELEVEPLSFSHLALSFLMDEREVDQNQLDSALEDLKERHKQGKEYPGINNHLGICFLIFWRRLLLEAQNQLRLAVDKDAKFQKAKTNLIFLESSEKKNSPPIKDLRF